MGHDLTKEEKIEATRAWVGEGKVVVLGKVFINDQWFLDVEEDKKVQRISCEDEIEADQLIEINKGKNNKTYAADEKYLQLNGWTSRELATEGFKIRHLKLKLKNKLPGSAIRKVTIPSCCGTPYLHNAMRGKKKKKFQVTEVGTNTSTVRFLINIDGKHKRFDHLINLISREWPLHERNIEEIGIENIENKSVSVWKRQVAKDGTSKMELVCHSINGEHFTHCLRNEMIEAIGNFRRKDCNLGKKKKVKTETICTESEEL